MEHSKAEAMNNTSVSIRCTGCGMTCTIGVDAICVTGDEVMDWLTGGGATVVGKLPQSLMIMQTKPDNPNVQQSKATILQVGPKLGWECGKCHAKNSWRPISSAQKTSSLSDAPSKRSDDGAAKPTANSLIRAAHSGDAATVQILVAKGADINARGLKEWTALIAASEKGHRKVVQELLARGADTNARTSDGETALMRASANGHGDIVGAILGGRPDVNARSLFGETALSLASKKGHHEIVKALRASGASSELWNVWFKEKREAEKCVSDEMHLLMLVAGAPGVSERQKTAIIEAAKGRRYVISPTLSAGDRGFDLVFWRL
jgi:hypothetical protein